MPHEFWEWTTKNCTHDYQRTLIDSAQKAYRRGGWPWDRAFMQAAAYLAVIEGMPDIHSATEARKETPFWVAIDKHTSRGKEALSEAARIAGSPVRQVSWVSFYFESALTNDSTDSYWWTREIQWRLSRVGLDHDKAQLIWAKTQPIVLNILGEDAERLKEHLSDKAFDQCSSQRTLHSQKPLGDLESPQVSLWEIEHLHERVDSTAPYQVVFEKAQHSQKQVGAVQNRLPGF